MTKQINAQLQYVPKVFLLSEQTPSEDGGPNGTHVPNTWRLNAYNRRRRREPFRITVPTCLLIVVESFERNVAITHGVTIHGRTIIKDDLLLERFSTTFVRERLFVQNYVAFILKSNSTTEDRRKHGSILPFCFCTTLRCAVVRFRESFVTNQDPADRVTD
jgi:hypothetical protein